jgi:hypothetical protein
MSSLGNALLLAAASPTSTINPEDGDAINWKLSRTNAYIRKIRPAATGYFVCGGGEYSHDSTNQYLATTTDFAQFTSITLPSITAISIGYRYNVSDVCYANNTIIAVCQAFVGTANWAILLKSTDNGSTWTEINLGNYTPYDIVFCDGRWVVSTNLTTIFYSSDNFVTYSTVDNVSNFNYLAVSGTTVIVGHSSGVSTLTFSPSPTFINRTSILTALGSSTDVRNVVVDPDTVGDVIYVLTSSGAVAIWNNFASSQLVLSGAFGGFYAYARVGNRRVISGTYYGYTSTTVGPTNGGAAMTWTSDSRFSGLSDAIALGNNITIVGGSGYIGTMVVSGSTFTYSSVLGGNSPHRLAAYGNGTFVVAKSSANSIITSTDDGKSWSAAGQNNAIVGTQYSLKFLNGKFYMGCGSGRIYYSTDGKTWTEATVNLNSGVSIHYDIVYMNSGRLVTVGTLASQGGNAISYISDDDGLTWNRGTSNFPTLHNGSGGITLGSLEYDGTYVYAYSSIGNTSFYSSDGSTWALLRAADRTHTSIAANSTTAVAIGQGIVQKSDGNNWTIVATPNIVTANKVVWLSSINQFVILGSAGYLATLDSTATTLTTYPVTGSSTAGNNTDILYDSVNGRYIAVIGGSIKVSTDLSTWTTVLSSTGVVSLAFVGGSAYVAIGSSATLYHSTDNGTNWLSVPTMLFNGDFTSVVWHQPTSKWWALLSGTTTTSIYSSSDGQSWELNAQNIVPVSSKSQLVVRGDTLTALGTSTNAGVYFYEYDNTITGGAGAGKYAWINRGSNESFICNATNGTTRIFGSNRGELFKVNEAASFINNTFSKILVSAAALPATHYNTTNGVITTAPTDTSTNGISINDIVYWSASGTQNANQDTYYAVTNAVPYTTTKRSGMIVQSSDGGVSWFSKIGNNGITSGVYPYNIYGIAARNGAGGSLVAIADYGRLVIQTNLNNTNANFQQWGFGRSFVDYKENATGSVVAIGLSPDSASASTSSSARLGQYGGLYTSSGMTQSTLSPTMTWGQLGSDTDKYTSLAFNSAGTVWVAVGLGGIIYSSSNGARSSGTTNNLFKVYWSSTASQFIAVGESGTVVTSSDGTTWTVRNTGSTGCFYDVTEFSLSGSGINYVIVGQTGSLTSGTTTPLLIYSTSLTNTSWTQVTSFGAALTKTISAISYDSAGTGRLLIAGQNSSGNIVFAETTNSTSNGLTTWTAKSGTYGSTTNVSVTGIRAYNSNFYITVVNTYPRVFLKYDTTANTISDFTYTAFTGDTDAPTQTWSGKTPQYYTAMTSNGTIVGTNGFMAVPSGSNFTIKCPGYNWIAIASDGVNGYVLTASNFTGYSVGVVVTTTTPIPQDGLTPRQAGSFSAGKVKFVGSYYIAFGGSYLSSSYYMYSSDNGQTWTERNGNSGSYSGFGYRDVVYVSANGYYYFIDTSSSVTTLSLFRTNNLSSAVQRVATPPQSGPFIIPNSDGDITFYGQGYYLAKYSTNTHVANTVYSGLFGPGTNSTIMMDKESAGDSQMMTVLVSNSIQIFGSPDGVKWKSISYNSGFTPSTSWGVKYINDENTPHQAFYLYGTWNGTPLNYNCTDLVNFSTLNTLTSGPFGSGSAISDIAFSSDSSNKGIVTTNDGKAWIGIPSATSVVGDSPSSLLLDTNIAYKIFSTFQSQRFFLISTGTSPTIRWADNLPTSLASWSSALVIANRNSAINSISYSPNINKFVLMGARGNILNSTVLTTTFDSTMYQRNSTAGLSSSINFSKCVYASNRLYIASSNNDAIFYTDTASSYNTSYSLSQMNTSSINTAVTDMIEAGTNKIILSYSGDIRVVDTSTNTRSTVQILDVGKLGMSRVAKKGSEYIWTGNAGALMTTNYDGTLISTTYNYKIPYVGSSPFIRYANGVFLIGGNDNIYYGFTTPVNLGNMYPTITSSLQVSGKPVWTGDKFIFGSTSDSIYTSNDGTSWTLRKSSINNTATTFINAIATKNTAPKANIAVGNQIFRN